MSPLRLLYTLTLYAATPLIALHLAKKGRLKNWRHCLGYIPPLPPAAPPTVWLHAVSVGEAAAAAGLICDLREHGCRLVLTHTTTAGGEQLHQRHGEYAHIYPLPLDFPGAVNRFMRRIRPHLGIIMEAEYWPNLLATSKACGTAMMLANARLGRANARRYARVAPLLREMAGNFDCIAAQTRADARRLAFFGARRPAVVGNLKFDRTINIAQARQGEQWRQQWQQQSRKPTVLIAGSRRGEEALLLRAMDADFFARYFVIFAPRHPERGDEIGAMLAARNINFNRRSQNQAPAPAQTAAYLADTLGEMDAFYACCDAALIGGSFLPFGGQNPIEAMASGTPAVIGPHAENYAALVAEARQQGALRQAADAADAMNQLRHLTADPQAASACGSAARRLCAAHAGALAAHVQLARHLLAAAPPPV